MAAAANPLRIAFTFDLHDVDLPDDIACASQWLRDSGFAATFFVPSSLLLMPRYADVLRALPRLGHEVGSHGHLHDWNEIEALMSGGDRALGFLERSRDLHADFFGVVPASFRSPRWCRLGRAAIDTLARLGYRADSSATPQRFPLFSSTPFEPGWWSSPRRMYPLAPGLVEVPTSTLLLPGGAPTFLTLRQAGSAVLLALLEFEARLDRNHPIVLQFHVEDFTPGSRRDRSWGRPTWRDFALRGRGGFRIKLFLRETNPDRIVDLHRGLVARYEARDAATVSQLAASLAAAPAMAAPARAQRRYSTRW